MTVAACSIFCGANGEIPGTGGEIEHHVPRLDLRQVEREALPGTVATHRHEIVRQVISPCNSAEKRPYVPPFRGWGVNLALYSGGHPVACHGAKDHGTAHALSMTDRMEPWNTETVSANPV